MAAGLVESTSVSTAASTSTSTAISSATSSAGRWFDNLPEEDKAYIQTRGLADQDVVAAFTATAKAHREAQSYMGVPNERLLKLPAPDAKPEEWDAVYQRLGYSTNPDDYKLEGLKFPDGRDVPATLTDHVRAQAQALHLSPAAAKTLAEQTIAFTAGQQAAQTSEQQIAAATAAERLRQNWGPNYQANMTIAEQAYAAIMAASGFDQATMTATMQKLREVQGTENIMQMLFSVGQRLGEANFVGGGGAPHDPAALIASVEQAKARKAELLADKDWGKRYMAGGSKEIQEMAALDMRIVGIDARGEAL